ncbi:uncharacterized protein LOC125067497 [Vanessa atalanta]|uniref:uncharacterized protein LOC125067497 n=1 Tax=Vanessa atalanta TaxID=42275 RepID=UPI001FCD044B|nr:uncharacterized protein LOC125067497 [Vanessa atalanta]
MRYLEMVTIIMHLTSISPKRYKHISSESIENILYYKDCNHKQKPTVSPVLRTPPQQQECKMCCTMCCGDQCVDSQKLSLGRQMQGQNNIQFEPKLPQPNIKPLKTKQNKMKPILPQIPPVPGRRGFGFTKENVKALISKDEDIRKILKDLVRVTMQKVDLMNLLNGKQNENRKDDESIDNDSDSENDL